MLILLESTTFGTSTRNISQNTSMEISSWFCVCLFLSWFICLLSSPCDTLIRYIILPIFSCNKAIFSVSISFEMYLITYFDVYNWSFHIAVTFFSLVITYFILLLNINSVRDFPEYVLGFILLQKLLNSYPDNCVLLSETSMSRTLLYKQFL